MSKKIEKYDFKNGLLHEFEIIDLSELYQNNFEQTTSPHRLEFYQVLWFKKGTSKHWVDFNALDIEPNTLLFLNKNSVQRFDKKGYPKGKAILFTDNFFCKTKTDTAYLKSSILFNDLFSIPKFKVESESFNLQKTLNLILAEFEQPKDDYQADILRNHLKNFLLHSERERKNKDFIEIKKDNKLHLVMQFKELLESNFIQHKNVTFYCEQMHITPKKLNSATTNVLEKPPKSIIIERILLEAKRMLVHTVKNTKEISFLLGFEEPTNFIKFFRKHLKTTPLSFREQFNKE